MGDISGNVIIVKPTPRQFFFKFFDRILEGSSRFHHILSINLSPKDVALLLNLILNNPQKQNDDVRNKLAESLMSLHGTADPHHDFESVFINAVKSLDLSKEQQDNMVYIYSCLSKKDKFVQEILKAKLPKNFILGILKETFDLEGPANVMIIDTILDHLKSEFNFDDIRILYDNRSAFTTATACEKVLACMENASLNNKAGAKMPLAFSDLCLNLIDKRLLTNTSLEKLVTIARENLGKTGDDCIKRMKLYTQISMLENPDKKLLLTIREDLSNYSTILPTIDKSKINSLFKQIESKLLKITQPESTARQDKTIDSEEKSMYTQLSTILGHNSPPTHPLPDKDIQSIITYIKSIETTIPEDTSALLLFILKRFPNDEFIYSIIRHQNDKLVTSDLLSAMINGVQSLQALNDGEFYDNGCYKRTIHHPLEIFKASELIGEMKYLKQMLRDSSSLPDQPSLTAFGLGLIENKFLNFNDKLSVYDDLLTTHAEPHQLEEMLLEAIRKNILANDTTSIGADVIAKIDGLKKSDESSENPTCRM